MTEIELGGDIDTALTHFALVGLAAILDGHSSASRVRWTDDLPPRPILCTGLGLDEVAERVRSHAQHAVRSWPSVREGGGARQGAGLFTARAKVPAGEDWQPRATAVREARLAPGMTPLDGRMLLALGEPAWWRWERNSPRPDEGASRWEMKTRNQGQEFLVHRLQPLAEIVGARDPSAILSGLQGRTVMDEMTKNSPNSRTGTGLATPAPVDSATAWCALWGLSVAPTIARRGGLSRSPGVWPDGRIHPRVAMLPVFTRPVSVRRFAQVLASKRFDTVGGWMGFDRPAGVEPTVAVIAASAWLREQGLRAVAVFPVHRAGSASAPERQLLAGERHPLP